MVVFSKYISGQRGAQLLLESGRFHKHLEKGSRYLTTSTWRCQGYRIKKSPAHVILDHGDQSLVSGAKPHSHDPDNLVAEKAEFRAELKRKAADQHLSATQNLLTEALSTCPSEIIVVLPKLESLARIVQRSRADKSGSANHSEAPTSTDRNYSTRNQAAAKLERYLETC